MTVRLSTTLLASALTLTVLAFSTNVHSSAQGSEGQSQSENAAPKPAYNAQLAEQLGADQWGMSRYVMVILKAGEQRNQNPERAQALQAGHMANIQQLAEQGLLAVAGPFYATDEADIGSYRGIFILNVSTLAEAERLVAQDPAVQAGRLTVEMYPWYGSAALKQVNELHQQLVAPVSAPPGT